MLIATAVLVAVAIGIGVVLLRPNGEGRPDPEGVLARGEVYPASVVSVDEVPCANTDPADGAACRQVAVELGGGPDEGETIEIQLPDVATTIPVAAGDDVIVAREATAPEGLEYSIVDRDRRFALLLLAVLFGLVVVVLGRLRGVTALVGLVATVAILLTFVLPAILDGRNPTLVAVVGAAVILYLVLYLAHGFTLKTTVALLGTLAGLATTAVLAEVFVELAHLTGLSSEEAGIVTALGVQVDLAGLILAGVIIGAMGAIDDVAVTQASAVWELHRADPTTPPRDLARAGLRLGRDHVASIVNTLVLAYAGASLPLLIVFTLSQQSLGIVANSEVVATEIVRTLVGSIGLVAAVPVTTWLASRVVASVYDPDDEGPLFPPEGSFGAEPGRMGT
ncbi:MAG: YibE/F family protein [Actinomycetota bacterium]